MGTEEAQTGPGVSKTGNEVGQFNTALLTIWRPRLVHDQFTPSISHHTERKTIKIR